MAIVVLVLWLFTAGAGFSLLATSNLGRSQPAPPEETLPAETPAEETLLAEAPAVASVTAAASTPAAASSVAAPGPTKREQRRAARGRFDPPSLTASRNAPIMPGLRPLLEFAHPALAVIGLGFWLGFTLVHNHLLGWIAFGIVAATVCLGLTWFTANARAAKRRDQGETSRSFGLRLVVLHGSGAAVTLLLAALSALVLSR